ncbi:MAG: ParB N-terminal domain-containing protein [Chromatiaceae bacterium]|nr:ParB N-terminal domain-containing protein [Chromatiaceae bacterium]
MKYDIHPVAALFPLIEGEAFAALVADIKANGLLEPIEFQGNTIIDGRNRLRACEAAGVVPQYHELPKTVDPVTYILQRNIHRRHLTTAQRAAIAAELANMAEGRPKKTGSNDPVSDHLSIEQAAEMLSVSAPSVKRAKARMKDDPEAHAAVKRGEKPKKQKEESDVRTYRTINKVVLTEYSKLTGKVMGTQWAGDTIKPIIRDRLSWAKEYNWAKEISEDRADEVRRVVRDYVYDKYGHDDSESIRVSESNFAMVEAAETEAEAIKQEIALPEKNKLQRAIKAYEKLLDLKLEQRIKQHMDEILPMYAEEYDRYKAFNDTYSGVFNEDEYRLLISVLHPDRCQPERATQFAKAFHLIKSKEEVLCKVKANDRPTSLPSTLEELIARRVRH